LCRLYGFGLWNCLSDAGIMFDAFIVVSAGVCKLMGFSAAIELFRVFRCKGAVLSSRTAMFCPYTLQRCSISARTA
jgi:hypothetical protein